MVLQRCVCWITSPDALTQTNVVLMLDQRRRRWPNIKTALGKRLVHADQQLYTYRNMREQKAKQQYFLFSRFSINLLCFFFVMDYIVFLLLLKYNSIL